MKKIISLILVFVMCISIVACNNQADSSSNSTKKGNNSVSEAVKSAEEAINSIGTVTIDSGDAIARAEKLYNILTDGEKEKVNNRIVLVDARETYEKLKKEVVFTNAKQAYEKINEAADICIQGMDCIYAAWYYGIYDADDHKYTGYWNLALAVPGFTSEDIETAGNALNFKESYLALGWEYSLYVVEKALDTRGDFTRVDTLLSEANTIMSELTNTYSDYEYYPKLKEYYAKVSSYAEFFKSPSGSFNQLSGTINDYENSIRTYKSDVGFLFS